MKTLKCDLCEVTAKGENFEEWMRALQPHYKEAHPEAMKESDHSEEDAKKWMAENKVRFENTPEDTDTEQS
ncbi:hypothetical protein H0W91_02280 [Patescibacteria group bacterium]|nr:hypothetical protein [Patescibacteria group bacterium]